MQMVRNPCHSEPEGVTTKLLDLLHPDRLISVWGCQVWPGRFHVCLQNLGKVGSCMAMSWGRGGPEWEVGEAVHIQKN